jgi:hypothetical protein
MQCACAILSSTVFFPHYLLNGTIFRKKCYWARNVFWFSLQCLSEAFLILRGNKRDVIKNVYWSTSKVLVLLVRFQWNLNLLYKVSIITQIYNFLKIRLVGAEWFHTDGRRDRRTEMTKLVTYLRNFANAPKNENLGAGVMQVTCRLLT